MANNLHISYDLHAPDKNYDKVISKIKSFGGWAKIHKSFWYVKSSLTAAEARDALLEATDKDDTIYIVDATNNTAAWNNIHPEASTYIKARWNE